MYSFLFIRRFFIVLILWYLLPKFSQRASLIRFDPIVWVWTSPMVGLNFMPERCYMLLIYLVPAPSSSFTSPNIYLFILYVVYNKYHKVPINNKFSPFLVQFCLFLQFYVIFFSVTSIV